jgi:PilZ domain
MKSHMPERRAEPRLLCSDIVEVAWTDNRGRSRKCSAVLEDISVSGACLQLEQSLPEDVDISIDYHKGQLEGTVRYCVFREIGYFAGIQFANGQKWSREEFRPQHLLDLKKLILGRDPTPGRERS